MRKYCTAFVLFGIAIMVLGVISPAAVVAQDTNNPPSVTQGAFDLSSGLPKPTCPILDIHLDNGEDNEALDDLGIAYTLVTPAAFSTVNLDNFHVLYVGWDEGADPAAFAALNARKSDIASWVQRGNSIVALAEYTQAYTWIPLAVTMTVEHGDTVTITAPSHAIMTGLTDGLLSDWGNSYHVYFNTWDPSFTVLAQTPAHDLPVTLVAAYGAGYIIITGHDADYHTVHGGDPGAALLLNNMLSYACTAIAHAVGGVAVPVNKVGLLAPWIAVASVVSLAGAVAVALKKRKR